MRKLVIKDIKRKTSIPRATIKKAVETVLGVQSITKNVAPKKALRKVA